VKNSIYNFIFFTIKYSIKMKGKAPASKASKQSTARKNAEAQKAKKKEIRTTKGNSGTAATAKKGNSVVNQSKNAKKK
jgi:hypothetical protein